MIAVRRMGDLSPALFIGGAIGFLSLFMREAGVIIGVLVLVVLGAIYLRGDRHRALAWLLIGAAIPIIALLGPISLNAMRDPVQSQTVPETLFGVIAGLLLGGAGIALLIVTRATGGGEQGDPR
jgi:hypothetical protein